MDPEELAPSFVSVCSTVLDSVAPFKAMCPKRKVETWLNNITRAARAECRRTERKWRKDRLVVSVEYDREMEEISENCPNWKGYIFF